MSQEPLRAGPLSDDATHSSSDDRSVIDSDLGPGNRQPARRPPLRARPQSWHPYGPVEPPLEVSSSRPIGVHAILNPPAQGATDPVRRASVREQLSRPGPPSSPRPRQGSSPALRSVYPLVQHPLSPKSHPRSLINPGSPSARFVGTSGRTSGQSSVAQSPLVPQEPTVGSRQPPPVSSPLPLDATLRPIASQSAAQPLASVSLHSTPSIHSRRTSAGPGPLTNPNSQETSPSTPHSTFSHFGRASPAVTNVTLAPSAAAYAVPTPYITMESLSRGTLATAGPRSSVTEDTAGTPGMIPCLLDLKSGSTSQAEKRKANSDASRRFRNRKRNEMQLEQRLTAQQDEIQRHAETVRRQSEEIRSLLLQRDHYRSERDFFRDALDRSGSAIYTSPRPPSPRLTQPSLVPVMDTPAAAPAWSGVEGRSASGTGQSQTPAAGSSQAVTTRLLDSARPQASWPGSPAAYSPEISIGRSGPPPVSGVSLPPFQGSWSRT
ncbi:uncharacterized protein N7482_001049 [Penicillium canariense]|uniref:BZIP domain-containing protein n=1 Tax=Penicillium canariense TaxID=189055 RepID=A0A9W9LTR1_9EURO|nr:uncharacterized protein N7482_001049 [Penicillium canariense]KAJ5175172.1 hypothetical protein N7482_001049 [Penicillium canariense]